MAIRIPQNQIQFKYTSGKEYMVETTYKEYQGYYYELNGKLFAGKEFNSNAPTLIKIKSDSVNTLLTNASTYVYGKISKIKLPNANISSIPKLDDPNADKEEVDTYYAQKVSNKIIKQIDKETYQNIQSNPLYKTVTIKPDWSNLNQAEKIIPGIKLFISPTK